MTLLSGDKGKGYNRADYTGNNILQMLLSKLSIQNSTDPHTRLGLKMADQTELFMEFNTGQFTY